MTTHDTRVGAFCRYCDFPVTPGVFCFCPSAVAARDKSRKQRGTRDAEELATALISQGWMPPES